jgi:hypothetical protein
MPSVSVLKSLPAGEGLTAYSVLNFVKVKVILRPTVSRSVCLGVKLGSKTRILLPLESWGFVDVGRRLSREDGSVVYNRCWLSPAQSFSGPSHPGLMTIFYCRIFETHPTWRARSPYLYPPGTGWPSYTPRHWVPFSSPPTSRRATVEVFEPASRGVLNLVSFVLDI